MMPIASTLNGVDMIRLRDTVLTAPCFGGTAGDYPWDRWGKVAIQAGLDADLANLGRSVFRAICILRLESSDLSVQTT